jgi:hypothetical protein
VGTFDECLDLPLLSTPDLSLSCFLSANASKTEGRSLIMLNKRFLRDKKRTNNRIRDCINSMKTKTFPSLATSIPAVIFNSILLLQTWLQSEELPVQIHVNKQGWVCTDYIDKSTSTSLRNKNTQPFRCAWTAKSMSSVVVLSIHTPESPSAIILHTPAISFLPSFVASLHASGSAAAHDSGAGLPLQLHLHMPPSQIRSKCVESYGHRTSSSRDHHDLQWLFGFFTI